MTDEHAIMVRRHNNQWMMRCTDKVAGYDGWLHYPTEAEAIEAGRTHIYEAMGREACELLAGIIDILICNDDGGSGQHFCGRCDYIIDRNRERENPTRAFLTRLAAALEVK